jgi:DNA-binding NtrC family response regulator
MNGSGMNDGALPSSASAFGETMPQPVPAIVPLAELERRAILNALEYTRGDRAVAAHLLGIGRTTLYRKLKEYEFAC